MSSDSVVGHGFARVCMVGGPVLVAVAALLFGPLRASENAETLDNAAEHSDLLVTATNVISVGLVLMVFAILHVVHVLAPVRPAARIFGFLLVTGMMWSQFFGGVDVTVRGLALAAEPSVGLAVLEEADEALVVHFLIAPFYLLGAVGLAVVASRSGVVPRWSALFFGAWLLVPVGILSGVTVIAAVGALAILVAFWPFIAGRLSATPA